MIRKNILIVSFIAATALSNGSPLLAAEGILAKVQSADGKYCFLKFPAIKEETLYWARPVLKDASSSDIISYYGSCEHDPLGSEEVFRQRVQLEQARQRVPLGD